MPTYEYHCEACGHEFERFQKMSDEAVKICPECGQEQVQRRISSGGGVLFKGPGFYATDYRKAPPPQEKSDRKSGASEGETGGTTDSGKKSGPKDSSKQ